ncbi:ATP-grasp domain-containing protein [Streptomyces sp. NPDC048109]|uniref:ATP-grasp domain-containing protein n=1 Tax=unclassified Streptomyces TaxID=2593676 RepID=UPI0033E4B7A1
MTNLVMVMPYKAYLLAAKAEGFRVCAVWDPSLSSVMPTSPRDFPGYLEELRGIADRFLLTDFADQQKFSETLRRAVADFGADRLYHVGQEASMLPAYRVAEELHKEVNPSRAIENLNDKFAMRRLLAENGLSPVQFGYARHWREAAELLATFRLPVVVKPTELAGSRGVFLLEDESQLVEWGRVLDSYDYTGPVLIEEYLRGPEYSVESISSHGVHHVVGITVKSLGKPPLFVETGHLFPMPDSPRAKEISDLVVRFLTLSGYLTGPAHTEVIWTEHGPRLVESQARLAGDRIPNLVRIATGFDCNRAVFRALAGRPLGSVTAERCARVAYLTYPTGVLRAVRGLEAVRALDFVHELSFPFAVGDSIPPVVDSKTRHGYVVLHADSAGQADERVDRVRAMIEVDVDHEVPTGAGTS